MQCSCVAAVVVFPAVVFVVAAAVVVFSAVVFVVAAVAAAAVVFAAVVFVIVVANKTDTITISYLAVNIIFTNARTSIKILPLSLRHR